jgi:hypothetical protein
MLFSCSVSGRRGEGAKVSSGEGSGPFAFRNGIFLTNVAQMPAINAFAVYRVLFSPRRLQQTGRVLRSYVETLI